jgi:hypothetical protein
MKKTTVYIALSLLALALLGGCRKAVTVPSAKPKTPIVSESPAIPSPKTSPEATKLPETSIEPSGTVSPTPKA